MPEHPPYDKPSTLHPFALAVLNRDLARYGYRPIPGNTAWGPTTKKDEPGEEIGQAAQPGSDAE